MDALFALFALGFGPLLWITIAVTAGIVAARKNRSGVLWFMGALLFAPLILPLLALRPLDPDEAARADAMLVIDP